MVPTRQAQHLILRRAIVTLIHGTGGLTCLHAAPGVAAALVVTVVARHVPANAARHRVRQLPVATAAELVCIISLTSSALAAGEHTAVAVLVVGYTM